MKNSYIRIERVADMIIANETEYKMKTVIGFVSMTIN